MTNSDIRLQTSWYSNLKRKKLQKRLGGDGVAAFIDLLIYVGVNQSDGDLSRFGGEDIEAMAQWEGTPGEFMATLLDLTFIEGDTGSYRLHDWEENNPWAAGAKRRTAAAIKANRVRWESEPDATSIRTASEPESLSDKTGVPPSVSVSPPIHSEPKKEPAISFDQELKDFVDEIFPPSDYEGWTEPQRLKQVDSLDKLTRLDKFPRDEVFAVLRFMRQDDFWNGVFQSIPRLRDDGQKKYRNARGQWKKKHDAEWTVV